MAILTPIIMPKKIHFNTLVLHSVVCGLAVKLQGLNAVSVVKEPGYEVFHGLDGIFLCVMAQDDTGVLIGESRDDIGDDHVHITL